MLIKVDSLDFIIIAFSSSTIIFPSTHARNDSCICQLKFTKYTPFEDASYYFNLAIQAASLQPNLAQLYSPQHTFLQEIFSQ